MPNRVRKIAEEVTSGYDLVLLTRVRLKAGITTRPVARWTDQRIGANAETTPRPDSRARD